MDIFLDITRVATRTVRSTPTGIDRTEFAYAKELLFHRSDVNVVPVLTTPWFSGAIGVGLAREVISRVESTWQQERTLNSDIAFQRLLPLVTAPLDFSAKRAARVRGRSKSEIIRQGLMFPLGELWRARKRLKDEVLRETKPAAYLHTSHTQLERPSRFEWTYSTTRIIKPAFFVHDVIPIDYPEFCSPGAAARHAGRLDTVSKLGHLIIANSQYTVDRIHAHLSKRAQRIPPSVVVPLGVEDAFLTPNLNHSVRAPHPYFVYVGTIEPRKNLSFLLAVWRSLSEVMGAAAPRLIIVGRRGWENENILDLLERSTQLAPFVVEVSDLTDQGLVSLLAGSLGLVSASFVEGFGLPLVEALALPVPVIVSGIPAHREAAEERAIYLSPIDGRAWISTITSLVNESEQDRLARRGRLVKSKQKMTWSSHVNHAMNAVLMMSMEQ